jgi:hypothetical protein
MARADPNTARQSGVLSNHAWLPALEPVLPEAAALTTRSAPTGINTACETCPNTCRYNTPSDHPD